MFRRDPNKSLTVMMSPKQRRYCLGVGADAKCAVGFGIASGWAFLIDSAAVPPWLEELLNLLWVALMFFAAGFCTYNRRISYATVLLLALVLLVLPRIAGLPTLPRTEAIGGLVGLLNGWYCRMALQRTVLRLS